MASWDDVRRIALALPETGERLSRELRQWRARLYFTTPHFDGYAAILVRLDAIGAQDLDELIIEAWLARASTRLAEAYLAGAGG